MPSKSRAQHNLMEMVAHDPEAAQRLGIPQSVGRDFVTADQTSRSWKKRRKVAQALHRRSNSG